MNKSSVVVV